MQSGKRFDIKGSSFVPPPKVDVALVKFTPLIQPVIDLPFNYVEKFVRHLFHYRNKSIRKSVDTLFPHQYRELVSQVFDRADIDPVLKPTFLSVKEIGRLCTVYHNMCEDNMGLFEYDYRARTKLPKVVSAMFSD